MLLLSVTHHNYYLWFSTRITSYCIEMADLPGNALVDRPSFAPQESPLKFWPAVCKNTCKEVNESGDMYIQMARDGPLFAGSNWCSDNATDGVGS